MEKTEHENETGATEAQSAERQLSENFSLVLDDEGLFLFHGNTALADTSKPEHILNPLPWIRGVLRERLDRAQRAVNEATDFLVIRREQLAEFDAAYPDTGGEARATEAQEAQN